ncbi:ABC transporter ATP-binding protein [Candidatus Uabimicrobium amorphum]|uniref:Sugar ABC transporter ATP-binding protein n=1 Tax=Uabimicrobium amorphum TaxID=2596890 RepID=A0A5S9F3T5_UABAM|nr:sn-glycerol-3-phosphate ABC transporter ATP-binding protein UgpC [Candidatus Uabimicrobium amorphum]BBM83502.1 sugar ABC transporter ATP-binding protein [Candidatus Uabimicrobium amorphum]
MAQVKFENVSKRYGSTSILENFNLEIRDKEFLVLVGPSGCGKSTTLRMIAGLETVSSGKLLIGDTIVNKVAPRDRNIAMVFQDYALYPHLTVADNMAFGLKMQGVPKQEIQDKVSDVSKTLGLEELLQRKPKQLSGGQRQRVAIGRAIVRNPKVFLFDEPLSNLDAKLRVQMRVEISRLHKTLNTTIVYVTHDQIEAMTLADRIVVMKDGYIQQVGTPIELYEKPANAFVGSFIGSPVMNQVQGKVDKSQITGEGFSLTLDNEFPPQEIILGIRPQDLQITLDSDQAFLTSQIDIVEPIGSETYIYFTVEGKQWVAKCDGLPKVKEGENISFSVNKQNIHLFSKDGTKRIN